METAEDIGKDSFYDELNVMMSKIPSQRNRRKCQDWTRRAIRCAKKKWYYPAESTLDKGGCLVDLCEYTCLIIVSTFKRNHRAAQLTWQG
ncbi:hypothetical protein RB195_025037 [Necator americanus]|uniref:Uncharacterized protein n=1 Tax=Necator americanus TaxID=51031 RepID=A0ABR1EQV2_NECAM